MSETLIDRSDGVVTVTFNRPDVKNALNADSWAALEQVLYEVARNDDDRALVLTGAGADFSSGADLSFSNKVTQSAGEAGEQRKVNIFSMRTSNEIMRQLQRLPKPTLAVVDGVAAGVSLGLALSCDLLLASDRARFIEIFVRRGLSMDGGNSWLLPRLIGLRRAKQMAFFGDAVGAAQALEWGLVNEVVPAADLNQVGREWALRLATGPTTAITMMKRLLDDSSLLSFEQSLENEAQAQLLMFATTDMWEGVQAFRDRRPPDFTGR